MIEAALGPLDAALPFTVAAGVPGFVPGYTFGGHHYNIAFGDQFLGSYGITTDELSCHGMPGACAY